MIKKIIASILILILLVNFFGFITGKITALIFWLILGLGFMISYFFFSKEDKLKKKRRK